MSAMLRRFPVEKGTDDWRMECIGVLRESRVIKVREMLGLCMERMDD